MTQIEVILLSLLYDKDYYGYEFETVIEQRNNKENLNKRKEFLLKRYNQHPTAKERPHIKALFERPIAFIETEISWIEMFMKDNF